MKGNEESSSKLTNPTQINKRIMQPFVNQINVENVFHFAPSLNLVRSNIFPYHIRPSTWNQPSVNRWKAICKFYLRHKEQRPKLNKHIRTFDLRQPGRRLMWALLRRRSSNYKRKSTTSKLKRCILDFHDASLASEFCKMSVTQTRRSNPTTVNSDKTNKATMEQNSGNSFAITGAATPVEALASQNPHSALMDIEDSFRKMIIDE
ncbi:unnamed protein product [Hymenolepis diminuta]|uniref:MADF domain-containing protein n=1 Tax=Hymenolepis diminuta TaxID=6216 RepID=A0A0R3SXR7_HYMDI|nr:unnamed protein product [Hymenolepis diminuta]VUZ47147.1 unnamed protein product [Hymenolepis diminuta]